MNHCFLCGREYDRHILCPECYAKQLQAMRQDKAVHMPPLDAYALCVCGHPLLDHLHPHTKDQPSHCSFACGCLGYEPEVTALPPSANTSP